MSSDAGSRQRAAGVAVGDESTEATGGDSATAPRAGELTVELAHLEIERLRADADIVHRISTQLSAELDLERLLQLLTDETTQLVGAQFGAFFYNVVDDRGERYMLYTLSGAPREAFARFPMPRNTALFAPTFRGDGVLRIDDVTKDPRYGQSAPYHGMPPGHLPVRSYLAASVKSRTGEVLGGLFFGHATPGMFTARVERLLVGVAAQGAVAIDNARLYERSKKQEQEMRALFARAEAARLDAERANRAKDEFLAMLGHELRNPLAPILTALQLMELRGDASTHRERTIIERQLHHMVRLVDDLLDVSRITRGKVELKRERVELADVVAKAIEMVGSSIEEKGHRLEVTVPRGELATIGDSVRLAQVVANLLTNAAKYTPAGGEIAVGAALEEGWIVLRVRDTGIGLAPEMIDRVFDLFVQERQAIDRSQGGLGLGLAIVRSLVQLHGGTVAVKSAGRGCGSEFVVRIPRAPDVAESVRERRSVEEIVARPDGKRVLVVDDNADAADLLVASLRAMGHVARATYDGLSALAAAADFKPQIVLLDIGLPVMDGYEVASQLLASPDLAEVRIVAVTGYNQESDRARSRAAGFHDHLVKPLRLEIVASVIDGVHT